MLKSKYKEKILDTLSQIKRKPLSDEKRALRAAELAQHLQEAALKERTLKEKKQEYRIAKMLSDPKGRALMTHLTDQTFRTKDAKRTVDQLNYLIDLYGTPSFLSFFERIQFKLFPIFSSFCPKLICKLIRHKLQQELSSVLLPQDKKKRSLYFEECKHKNIQLNLNHLGEAIQSEPEAKKRLKMYLKDLENPQVDYVSVKVSSIFSQISPVDWEGTLDVLKQRLRNLYKKCSKNQFVNLDMEEYRDLDLTLDLFQSVLDEPDFFSLKAGIVLQAYLPDSYDALKRLTTWANKRVQNGGSPIKIRLVKGANLAMEQIDASLHNWNQAPFYRKIESDAHFKKLLDFSLRPENVKGVHIGIGSHNLFDIAYALILRAERGVENEVNFEMLSGMAQPICRVIREITGSMILYSPDALEEDFEHAVSYLLRRLDENGGEENFLRHFFFLKPKNSAWKQQEDHFLESCKLKERLLSKRHRSPNHCVNLTHFTNIPDSDFSLKETRENLQQIYKEWENKKIAPIPLVIGGRETHTSFQKENLDPSRPNTVFHQSSYATENEIRIALECAQKAQASWEKVSLEKRRSYLMRAAELFQQNRSALMGAMLCDAGKIPQESDGEISEAIDFLIYYASEGSSLYEKSFLEWKGKGPVLVTPPWNFSCSIPVGGIAAALIAGNSVILKPAPQTPYVAWRCAEIFWEAGVPKEVLQFIQCEDHPYGSQLIQSPLIASVILTGASDTARLFYKLRPGLNLKAETGGKNALIISNLCDRDLAIRDLVASAFGHASQKCSACSLAILHKELFDDEKFKEQLVAAASSLVVSSVWNKSCRVPPLISPPNSPLKEALTSLREGEKWWLEPKEDPKNPHLWSCGIKSIQPFSFSHFTEFFGPLLGVLRAESLEHAIELANATPYGLTSGIHTLDPREKEIWKQKAKAGNLYINRTITGAIVKRQPFGGCKASSFGAHAKAGGPNYVYSFSIAKENQLPEEKSVLPKEIVPLLEIANQFRLKKEEIKELKKSFESYAYFARLLSKPEDFSKILGQENLFYHVPLPHIALRFQEKDPGLSILKAVGAVIVSKTPFSLFSKIKLPLLTHITKGYEFIDSLECPIRYLSMPSNEEMQRAAEKGLTLLTDPVYSWGRLELLNYMREQALSHDIHRYGYIDPLVAQKH